MQVRRVYDRLVRRCDWPAWEVAIADPDGQEEIGALYWDAERHLGDALDVALTAAYAAGQRVAREATR